MDIIWSTFLTGVTSLNSISLSYNSITYIYKAAFAKNQGLVALNLSHNSLQTLEFGRGLPLGQLSSLDVSFNKLSVINPMHIYTFHRLQYLNLNNNVLTKFDYKSFQSLYSLKYLDAAHNQISVTTASSGLARTMKSLNLAYNSLTSISSKFLAKLSSLRYLDLQHNSLTSISKDVFSSQTNLTTLKLHSNHISNIDPTSFANIAHLSHLTLFPNNLDCCSIGLWADSIKDSLLCGNYSINGESQQRHCAQCSSPQLLAGTEVRQTNTSNSCAAVRCAAQLPSLPPRMSLSGPCSGAAYNDSCPLVCEQTFALDWRYPASLVCNSSEQWGTRARCHDVTMIFPASPFAGQTFLLSRRKLNWTQAEDACVRRGGHLVTIDSQAKNDFVALYYEMSNVPLFVWTGLRSIPINNRTYEYAFIGTNQPVSFQPFSFQPTHPITRGKCVSMAASIQKQTWHDSPCYEERHFMCEFPASTTFVI